MALCSMIIVMLLVVMTTEAHPTATYNTTGRPRCGIQDDEGSGRLKFQLNGSRWPKQRITYRVTQYPDSPPRALIDRELARSFKTWEKVVDLWFTQLKTGSADIDIRWTDGYGKGEYPFDGPGGVLALALGAPKGFVHFDISEYWSTDGNGINLYQIAVHEIGHTLGLSHSEIYGAVMFPWAYGFDPNFSLHEDDIAGVQSLYAKRTTAAAVTTTTPSTTGDNELCQDATPVDAILSADNGNIYVFKGAVFYTVSSDGRISPSRPLSSKWPGLPSSVDSAFMYGSGKTYFLKGPNYWKYEGGSLMRGYPRRISKGFPGVPDEVDTAVVWSGNNKLYFFRGSQYWKFDQFQNPPVGAQYPQYISYWQGIPSDLDAAFVFRGSTYFVKQDSYFRIADDTIQVVDRGSLSSTFFGCALLDDVQRE